MDVTETRIPQKAVSRVRRTIFNDMIGLIISTVKAEKQTRTVRSMLGRLQMLTDWPMNGRKTISMASHFTIYYHAK